MCDKKINFKTCDLLCLKTNKNEMNNLLLNCSNEVYIINKQKTNYLSYAPVGNYAKKPLIIISGKTTSYDSSRIFLRNYKSSDLYSACFSSIYSNMKNNLYKYLNKIGLFNYMASNHKLWKDYTIKTWEKVFSDKYFSYNCGIQLTQAFNCAILNYDNPSNEPDRRTINEYNNKIGCLFKHFNITDKLKLIIFLDTPSINNKFHQIYFWKEYIKNNNKMKRIKTISITHPSSQNNDIYNKLDNLLDKPNTGKWANAKLLFKNAINEIQNMHNKQLE